MDIYKYFPHHMWVARPWRAPIRAIKDEWYNIKAFLRRGRTGWAYIDLWNMDNYLGRILPAMLRHLADKCCGCPMAYVDKYPDNDEAAHEAWKDDLRHIADLIEYANAESDNYNKYAEAYWEACGLGKDSLQDIVNKEVDKTLQENYYQEHRLIGDKQQAAIEEAMAWIGKHWFELWD